jgi:hypothetical protein
MENFSKYPPSDRPLVEVFSPPDLLGISLVENLLAYFFRIKIITTQKTKWEEKISHIENKSCLEVIASTKTEAVPEANYTIFNFFRETKDLPLFLNKAADYAIKNRAKTLVILPYYPAIFGNYSVSLPSNLGIIYLGDLLSPRMELDSLSETSRIIKESLFQKRVRIFKERIIFPLSVASVTKLLVKWLFSFGPYGEETAIVSSGISEETFYEKVKNYLSEIRISVKEEKEKLVITRKIKKIIVPTNIDQLLKETLDWFLINQGLNKKTIEIEKTKVLFSIIPFKISLLFLFLILLFPAISLLVSGVGLILAKNFLLKTNFTATDNCLSLAQGAALVAKNESILLIHLPLIGKAYETPLFYSNVIVRVANTANTASLLGEDVKNLTEKIFGDEIYDPEIYSSKISMETNDLYQQISFLQGEIDNQGAIGKWLTAKFLPKFDFERVKEYLLAAKTLSTEFPEILGKDKPTTYLILLQNNMELRPTGGFIGSFALATFDGGRLGDISVSDVYSADGQLRGHVEPPVPIKEYLGEANWYLRDANWDPDFPTSAKKIEWFLDKEIDKRVDGVIAVDLNLVAALLDKLGPINLADFNKTIDSRNLYETTQSQIENNFFPGSYQKTNFMTALTREILNRLMSLQKGEYLAVSEVALSSLEEKHIQIFLHNQNVQGAMANLNWDGGVKAIGCSNNCFPDWFGIVEANVGVNKANYYLKRQFSLAVNLNSQRVQKTLTITYQNKANPSLGQPGIYKVFLRLLSPAGTELISSKTISGENNEEIPFKDGGFLFEVSPGQTKSFVLTWKQNTSLNFAEAGEYRLFWRKQAGTLDDEVNLKVYLPKLNNFQSEPKFSLTEDGAFGYNTVLSRDFGSRILWK